jgi:putative tricarboxylic transport membrane protein
MDQGLLQNILYGFEVVLAPHNLIYCFVGVLLGTLVGVLPGLGPGAAISLLLPSTFGLNPASAIIMLAGIYYGAMYGGSTTSILVNLPGEAASVVTCLDGYKMALEGRAGAALGISAFGSFIGGTISAILLMLLAPPLTRFALRFGPPEYFSLIILGFLLLTYLASGSVIKALIMACLGIVIGCVGTDPISGSIRFAYGQQVLYDGFGFIPVIMGLFGISEVLLNIERVSSKQRLHTTNYKGLFPTVNDWKRSLGPIFRGTGIGFLLGILPGGGAIVSSFASYTVEKRLSRTPEKFGTGMIEGVAGPESANNAACSGGMVPLLTLGIPTNVIFAIMIGALLIHGVQPGPLLLKNAPDVFWGIIVSMYVGNVMLLILNLPMIGLWVQILKVPYPILFPLILLFCLIGAYSTGNNIGDLIIMITFGVFGYFLKKFEFEATPLVFALVLGPMFEKALRQSLLLSNGSMWIFIQRPISASLLGATLVLVILAICSKRRLGKEVREEDI